MPEPERTVLHVLPHPGGGGETYVDALAGMEGYRFERVYLAGGPDPRGARASILLRAAQVQWDARLFEIVHLVGEVASTLCLPGLAMRPSVLSLQGLSLVRRLSGVGRQAARANLQVVTRAATRTICASETEYSDLVAFIGPRVARRSVVIRNGVPLGKPTCSGSRASFRSELGISESEVVGSWVGTLDANKDPLTVVEAAKKARREGAEVKLLVAGDGPLRAEVERVARDGRDAVRVLGFRADVEPILGASDFFVLSSQREGLSFSLLEAMAHGLAPIVSDAPGNVEAVGDAGMIVPFHDAMAFAAAFTRLASEASGRQALGARARARVARRFSADEMLRRTRGVYDDVVGFGTSRG